MPHRYRAGIYVPYRIQRGLRLQGSLHACAHVHVCAHLRTPLAWPKASVSVSSPAQPSWERIQVPYAKKSLYPYNKAILIRPQKWAGHLWWHLSLCLEAEVQQQALGAQAAIRPGAQVVVQQLWRPPPRTAVLFGSLPAGTRLSKVLVQMSAYPALLQAGQLSGCQGLGGHWQTSLIQSSQDGLLPQDAHAGGQGQ